MSHSDISFSSCSGSSGNHRVKRLRTRSTRSRSSGDSSYSDFSESTHTRSSEPRNSRSPKRRGGHNHLRRCIEPAEEKKSVELDVKTLPQARLFKLSPSADPRSIVGKTVLVQPPINSSHSLGRMENGSVRWINVENLDLKRLVYFDCPGCNTYYCYIGDYLDHLNHSHWQRPRHRRVPFLVFLHDLHMLFQTKISKLDRDNSDLNDIIIKKSRKIDDLESDLRSLKVKKQEVVKTETLSSKSDIKLECGLLRDLVNQQELLIASLRSKIAVLEKTGSTPRSQTRLKKSANKVNRSSARDLGHELNRGRVVNRRLPMDIPSPDPKNSTTSSPAPRPNPKDASGPVFSPVPLKKSNQRPIQFGSLSHWLAVETASTSETQQPKLCESYPSSDDNDKDGKDGDKEGR